jgi:hypothetical protein
LDFFFLTNWIYLVLVLSPHPQKKEKKKIMVGMVAHVCHPSYPEAEKGRIAVGGHPGRNVKLYPKILKAKRAGACLKL